MNNPEKVPEAVYVGPVLGDYRNHPQYAKIKQIIETSEANFFCCLTEMFKNDPVAYVKIEEIVFNNYLVAGPSLLELIGDREKGLLQSPLRSPDDESFRHVAIGALRLACKREAEQAITIAHRKNGYQIAEIRNPDFSRFIDESTNLERRITNTRNFNRSLNDCLKNIRRDRPINLINSFTRPKNKENER